MSTHTQTRGEAEIDRYREKALCFVIILLPTDAGSGDGGERNYLFPLSISLPLSLPLSLSLSLSFNNLVREGTEIEIYVHNLLKYMCTASHC